MDLVAYKSGVMKLKGVNRVRANSRSRDNPPAEFDSSAKRNIYLSLILFIITLMKAPPVKSSQLSPSRHQQVISEQSASFSQVHETRCLLCIKNITSAGVDLTKRCEGYFCGAYQFSYQYWAEAGKPGRTDGVREFDKCARDTSCAELTVRAYFKRYKRDCNNDGQIDCLDMAALHKAGPTGCSQDWFVKSRYWQAFTRTTCAVDKDSTSVSKESIVPTSEPKDVIDNKQGIKSQAIIMKNQTLTSECLDCICESLSGCGGSSSSTSSANNCGSGTICGPFAISQSYWKDGRRPGASWTACTRTKECSIVTIKNYMDKHKRDCNGDGLITCEDYAAVHRRGPKACMNRDLYKEHYWAKFMACRANQKPKDDASLVRAGDESSDHQHSSTGSVLIADKESTIDVQSSGSLSRTTPIRMQPIFSETTTQSPPPQVTMSTPHSRIATTKVDRPYMLDGTRFVISTVNSATDSEISGGVRGFPSSLGPYDIYELSPISIASDHKPDKTESQRATFQTITTAQHTYQDYYPSSPRDEPLGDKNLGNSKRVTSSPDSIPLMSSTQPIRDGSSSSSTSSSSGSDTSENGDRVMLTTIQSHEYHHQSPIGDEFNSLPTIIVGKPLGALSTSHISQPPPPAPLADSKLHESNQIEQQHHSTRVMQRPTTLSIQAATTTTKPTDSINSFPLSETAIYDMSAATTTNLPPISTKSSDQTGTTLLLNQGEPIDADYLVHDLGPTGFDRVVNGIVANPDFSKSYPPRPEHLIQQRKQSTSTSAQPLRGPTSQIPGKVQASSATQNHRNFARDPSQFESLDGKRESDRKHNQSTSSPRDHQQSQAGGESATQMVQSPLDPLSGGSDANLANGINLTHLFGDGSGLNETNRIPNECLDCICDASSNCDPTVQCISKQREKNRCGLYMISWNQYKESDIELVNLMSSSTASLQPTASRTFEDQNEKLYYECSTDKNCAEKLIHLYIEKYSKDCNNDGVIDCFDIAALHRVGPDQCNSDKFLRSQYWRDFNHCYATDRLTTTVLPQQVG